MKLRTLFLAALLAGGFLYFTSSSALLPTQLNPAPPEAAAPLWSAPEVARSASLSTDEQNNIDIYKRAHDATVNITSTVYRRDFFFDIYPDRQTGSGFLVNSDGLIITNSHVVSGTAKLQVTLADRSVFEAQLLEQDPTNDLALIKIAPNAKVEPLRLGDSDTLQVGQKVLAIGNPFGLEGTLTTGIVSSIGRDIRDEQGNRLEGMIQTDAAINPGNSGGPLLDSQGNVIGVNTAIYGPGGSIGIGFAMPINRVKLLMEVYENVRRYGRPTLGISGVFVDGDIAVRMDLPRQGGLLIYEVDPGAPAAGTLRGAQRWVRFWNQEVGIGGDMILSIDGQPVSGQESIRNVVRRKRPGDTVELGIYRGGSRMNVSVRLGRAR